jgi:endonuclease/exonuclease/phosphatase family metal-dependent hydrolase
MTRLVLFVSTVAILSHCNSPKPITQVEATKLSLTDSSIVARPVDYQYPDKETFTLLSWNVEHFVDPFDDPYINNRRENNPPENMSARVSLLIKAFRMANADIVVLQEFESEKYLMTLAKDSFPELGYKYFADAASPDWYMNVVMMSRFPLGELKAYGDVTTPVTDYVDENGQKETQSHINTRMWTMQIFPSEDYQFWLTAVHLKAGRGERNIAMRTGQINYLLHQFERLTQLDPGVNLMMAGDFNAYPSSVELELLTEPREDKVLLIDPMDSAVLSHPADSPQRRLDYLLVNTNMEKEMVKGTVDVVYFFSPDSMRMLADHLPVMGEFLRTDQN